MQLTAPSHDLILVLVPDYALILDLLIDRSSDPQRIYKDQIIELLANYHNIEMEQELGNYHVSNDEDKDTLITVRGLKTVKVILRSKQKSTRIATFDNVSKLYSRVEESFKDRMGVMVTNVGYRNKASRRSPSKEILLCVKN
ncbi:hypothetical protein F8M41_006714 [Gigaspora margarita]|uniref:Uncharacterized protein n=1 Tax=Gigaspora margarita TaxID=4874 RepID=A0A8H3X7K0_GIGMA|nr:hypothetical protein F8M41_006714 [Gigaspora margarita]